jgi:REP element-mobilizing transposase RayT
MFQSHFSCARPGSPTPVAESGQKCVPNHVHLIMVPADEFGLRDALGEAHRRYTRMINFRKGWKGHLWQERFHSL